VKGESKGYIECRKEANKVAEAEGWRLRRLRRTTVALLVASETVDLM
jgi:hypothetical protein